METMNNMMPREKIQRIGAKSLSNEELLAVILGSGTRDCDVFELSRRLSIFLSELSTIPTIESLCKIRGLGAVKATQILACLELSARYILSDKAVAVKTPEDLVVRLSYLKFENQEHFILVSLDSSNNIINTHDLTKGLVNQAPVHPREAFAEAIVDRAVSVIFVHNHPSGNTVPSFEDVAITKMLCSVGKIMQIPVVDHIVVGKCGFTSICRERPEIFNIERE